MRLFSKKPVIMMALAALLLALIPLTFGGLFFLRAQQTVQQQQLQLARSSTQTAVSQLNNNLESMFLNAIELGEELRYLPMPAENQLTVSQRLRFYDVRQRLIALKNNLPVGMEAIYLADPSQSYALGDWGMSDLYLLKKRFYPDLPDEEYQALHTSHYYGNLLRLSDGRQIFVRSLGHSNSSKPPRQLVFVLRKGYYDQILAQSNVMHGLFCLSDTQNRPLSIDNPTGVCIDEQEFKAISQAPSDTIFEAQSGSLYLYRQRLAVGNYVLWMLTPYEHLMQNAQTLGLFYWTMLALALLLIALLVILLTRNSVLPISKLITYIEKNYANESGGHDLQQLHQALEQMTQEQENRKQQLIAYEEEQLQAQFRALLLGEQQAMDEAWSAPPYGVACLYVLEQDLSLEAQQAYWTLVRQGLHRIFPERLSLRLLEHDDYLVLVMGGSALNLDKLAQWLENLMSWLDERSQLTLVASISRLHEQASGLPVAYREACMAMEYSFTQQDKNVLRFDECEFKGELFLRDWHHIDKQLRFAQLVYEDRFTEALSHLDTLFPEDYLKLIPPESNMAILHLQSLKYQFLHDIDRIFDVLETESEARDQIIQQLLYCKTHRKLYKLIRGLLEEAQRTSNATDEGASDENLDAEVLMEQVRRYIQEHYADPQLCVASVAEAFSLNANALSKLFSRKSDTGVLHYIHQVRIEQAAVLMREQPKRTLAEIGALVGYSSQLTFARKFKAVYHVTPGEYRRTLDE